MFVFKQKKNRNVLDLWKRAQMWINFQEQPTTETNIHVILSSKGDEFTAGCQLKEISAKRKQKWIEIQLENQLSKLKHTLQNEAANLLTVSKIELEEIIPLNDESAFDHICKFVCVCVFVCVCMCVCVCICVLCVCVYFVFILFISFFYLANLKNNLRKNPLFQKQNNYFNWVRESKLGEQYETLRKQMDVEIANYHLNILQRK